MVTKNKKVDETKRDFLTLATAASAAVGGAAFVWPLLKSLKPSKKVLALRFVKQDLSSVEKGQSITISWQGKPVFIRRRTDEEIAKARAVNLSDLPDPQEDKDRVQKDEWLIVVGVCTHLGCVPVGQKPTANRGEYGGWFCPCHGSHYDTSGRIRKGPAPVNLEVPNYEFLDDTTIKIG